VTMTPGFLAYMPIDFKKPGLFNSYYMPKKDEKNTLIIAPGVFGLAGNGPFEYQFEVKAVQPADKLVVDVKDELTATYPPFKMDIASRAHHKSFDLKVKANTLYIIDMKKRDNGSLDSYLYLLDSKGKIVAQDDDSGGQLNARIIFMAPG